MRYGWQVEGGRRTGEKLESMADTQKSKDRVGETEGEVVCWQ